MEFRRVQRRSVAPRQGRTLQSSDHTSLLWADDIESSKQSGVLGSRAVAPSHRAAKYGMTIDNLVSAELVTADGEQLHISEGALLITGAVILFA
jgi:hypothetical protein